MNFIAGAERGARGSGARTKRVAAVIEMGWRAQRVFRCSIHCSVYGVVFLMYGTLGHFGCIGRLLVSYLLRCIIRQRAISGLDNARCALSRLVNAQLQAGERAFTEKACTLHGPKGAWHRAVMSVTARQCFCV